MEVDLQEPPAREARALQPQSGPNRTALRALAVLALSVLIPAASLAANHLSGKAQPALPPGTVDYSASSYSGSYTPPSSSEGSSSPVSAGLGETTPACQTKVTTVELDGPDTTGTGARALRFTNTGSKPCVLHGFPDVTYVVHDLYTQVGQAADRVGEKGSVVTLGPKAVAHASLTLEPVQKYDPSTCRPVPVKGLRIYLPGDIAPEFIATPGNACSEEVSAPQLQVKTIEPGGP